MAKKLGFGLMRLPKLDKDDAASIDLEQLKQMVDLFLERGFTYFDTAWMYCGFASENAAKAALVDRHPRGSFTLATKLHAAYLETEADRDRIFNTQLEKTGAGYFDYYLLHGIEADSLPKYEALDCFRWLLDKKARGLVRHAGFSFHDTPELLDKILTEHPEMEFVQLQLNYLDWENPQVQSRACYEMAQKHGKKVVVMEPVKGGTLAQVPPEAEALFKGREPELSVPSWGIRFAASLPGVMMVLSGMSSLEQMADNTGTMADFRPLTEEEQALCFRAAEIIRESMTVPCTGCAYCAPGCPQGIAIPQYFALYNADLRERKLSQAAYDELAGKFGKAGACVACGQCEGVCPQHLPIIRHLKAVARHYE